MNQQWGGKTWRSQLPLQLSFLVDEGVAVEFQLGPHGRFLRTNREICDVAPPERRQQRWRCSEGGECKKSGWNSSMQWETHVPQQHLYTGTSVWWTYSSGKVTCAFCRKEGKKPCWDSVLSWTHRQLAMDVLPRVTLDNTTQTNLHHRNVCLKFCYYYWLLALQELTR